MEVWRSYGAHDNKAWDREVSDEAGWFLSKPNRILTSTRDIVINALSAVQTERSSHDNNIDILSKRSYAVKSILQLPDAST